MMNFEGKPRSWKGRRRVVSKTMVELMLVYRYQGKTSCVKWENTKKQQYGEVMAPLLELMLLAIISLDENSFQVIGSWVGECVWFPKQFVEEIVHGVWSGIDKED